MKREILNSDNLSAALKTLTGWTAEVVRTGSAINSGDGVPGLSVLKKRFTFANFAEALEFVNRVGVIAEAADHHPDITFGWGYAELALTTHDRGGITDVDIALAKQIDRN